MTWLTDIWSTLRTVGVADAVDMAILASILYLVLLWFKQTKAAFVARGIFIFAVVYVIAQQSGMYLTAWLFQGFFAVLVIALVVIFQEELRSFFERVAVWSLRRRATRLLQPKAVETVVRTMGEFAQARIGALLVFKGTDPLERHLEGGETLNGDLSEPLLESLFDPHSHGHDGALIIEGDRVTRFAVHLPLSKEFEKLGKVGTRHSAALGLSERTDALCLVVSEERGTISMARDGTLSVVPDLGALEERLSAFFREKSPVTVRVRWQELIRRNTVEKAMAGGIAVALWLVLVQGFQPDSQAFQVPVEAHATAEDLRVAAVRPSHVNATLKGLRRDLQLLNPLDLRLTVILDQAEPGVVNVPISRDNFHIPGTVQLREVDPPVVECELAKASGGSGSLLGFLGLKSSDSADEEKTEAAPAAPQLIEAETR